MTTREFETLCSELIAECDNIRQSKGVDYTSGDDRLGFFKEIGEEAGVDPKVVLLVLMSKHLVTIRKVLTGQQLMSEGMGSRFADAINYLLLGYGLLMERKAP